VAFPVLPALRRHHPSNRAVVTVRLATGGRRDFYCGRWKSAAATREYRRICAVLRQHGGKYPNAGGDLSVNEGLLLYLDFAERYYGRDTSGFAQVARTARTIRELFGRDPLADFGPKALKTCQSQWVADGFVRKSINKMTGTVKKLFRWLVSEEVFDPAGLGRLTAVEGLRVNHTTAPDRPPVRPAVRADVERALSFMPPQVAALVRLQLLSAARGGELLGMRANEVDWSGPVWEFRPPRHKGTFAGRSRVIYFGPESQAILAPYLIGSASVI
jgi:integrase